MTSFPRLERRPFLKSAIAGAFVGAAGCAGLSRTPIGGLPGPAEIWDQQLRLNALGPRYTGNAAHRRFIDWISEEFEQLGLVVRQVDSWFTRWDARSASVWIGAEPLKASSYPYSMGTGRAGVSGQLVHAGRACAPDLSVEMRDRIVFLEAPAPTLPFGDWYAQPQLYGAATAFPAGITNAAAQVVTAPDLAPFAERGAKAVVLGWANISEEQAANQYLPFNRPLQPIPGIWVGPAAAVGLGQAARAGAVARVILDAALIDNSLSRTIYAELPGASPEVIIVNTHTDGPNAVEENGPIGLIALAKRLAAIPQTRRRRSVAFVMASGHFVGPQLASTDGFLEAAPQIVARTVGALAVEHLGAMEWVDQPSRGYLATGRPELSYLFTQDERLASLAMDTARIAGDARGTIARPKRISHFFGEGRPLARAGIPSLGFIPLPSYLLSSAGDGHIGKLEPALMHLQIAFVTALLDRLISFPFPVPAGLATVPDSGDALPL